MASQAPASSTRRPPRVAEEHGGRSEAPDHLHQSAGDEVQPVGQRRPGHAEVEVARDGEVAGEARVLEVAHAGRAHAGAREAVVEPGRGPVAEIVAEGCVDRREHLQEDENDAGEHERADQAVAALHGRDEQAHGNREDRGQDAAKQQDDPPRDGEAAVRLWQHREKLPLVALAQTLPHGSRRPQWARRPRTR